MPVRYGYRRLAAFRPERWVDFEQQRASVARAAKPLAELRRKHPNQANILDQSARNAGLSETELGYLPLASEHRTDWSVVVSLKDGSPLDYLHLDAW